MYLLITILKQVHWRTIALTLIIYSKVEVLFSASIFCHTITHNLGYVIKHMMYFNTVKRINIYFNSRGETVN